MEIFLDSSAIIHGLEFEESNSAIILDVMVEIFLRKHCTVIKEGEYQDLKKELADKIKEKDLDHIAAARSYGLKVLVGLDDDFKNFSEYETPREFLKRLRVKPMPTEY